MPVTITGVDDFATAIAFYPFLLADGRMAMAATHQPTPGSSEIAYSAAYLVNSATGVAVKVGQSEPFGKDTACTLLIIGTTLRLGVTEANPGGGGASNQPRWYDFPIGVGAAVGGGGADTLVRNLLKYVGAQMP